MEILRQDAKINKETFFKHKAECDILKWLSIFLFHEKLSDLFFWEKNKQSADSQQRSIGLKKKGFTRVPKENHFWLKLVSVTTQRKQNCASSQRKNTIKKRNSCVLLVFSYPILASEFFSE